MLMCPSFPWNVPKSVYIGSSEPTALFFYSYLHPVRETICRVFHDAARDSVARQQEQPALILGITREYVNVCSDGCIYNLY
jgi:hypothetical protein